MTKLHRLFTGLVVGLGTAITVLPASAATILADRVFDFFNSGANSAFPTESYGGTGPYGPIQVPLSFATDGNPNSFVSLPTGSFITLGFSKGFVFDGPGPDIFVSEVGGSNEHAVVSVSSDFGRTFTSLGIATTATVSGFDLASVGYTNKVNAVKIVGLDNLGYSPGFDLAFVKGLEGSVNEGLPSYFTSKANLPLGELKIWTGSKFTSMSSPEGMTAFDTRKDIEVLVHGWNGVGAFNTPLEDKWVADFAGQLQTNQSRETNILAYDWKEAANSREAARKYMVMSDLGISEGDYKAIINYFMNGPRLDDRLMNMTNAFTESEAKWEQLLDDYWVPNQQISRQASNLAQQLQPLIADRDSPSVSFFGHSLGAGVSTIATKALLDQGLGDKVDRLTLFDAPEDVLLSSAVGGRVRLDNYLEVIHAANPDLAIDNYVAELGFGKDYVDAANINFAYAFHGEAPAWYAETIKYNTSPSTYTQKTKPDGIGYDDLDGDLIRLRTGTECAMTGEPLGDLFQGLNTCLQDGFRKVDDGFWRTTRVKLDFQAEFTSVDAQVEMDPSTGLPTMTSGSPVFSSALFYVTPEMSGVEIDFEWLSRFDDDDFRVWLDDTLLFSLDGFLAGDGIITTGMLDLSPWIGGWSRLTFGVLSDFPGSTVSIRDIRFVEFVESNANSVPTPGTFALVLIGIVGIGANLYRHTTRG